jgi:pilus assembly protein CpaC
VYGDAKELELLLETEFPNASLRVRPLSSSVVISGWVDAPEVISRVVKMAEDYYPKVINNIRVGDNQQVQLHVQIMEVSRTKLRQLGIDWAAFGVDDFIGQSVGQLISETTANVGSVAGSGQSTMSFGLAGSDSSFFAVIDALRQHDLVKVLAEPVLTTISGRPAAFSAGGEFPIPIPQGLGTVAIDYKNFGTRVDFVPTVLGNGNVRLEVRPEVSETDSTRAVEIQGFVIPGIVNRWVDTAVEMRAGQTLALAGLIQDRVEAQNKGVPVLSDLPWAGALFRRVVQRHNEIELLVMVRPEFVDAMDPHEVPMFGPGEQTAMPSDKEMFVKGYIEVPTCCPDGSCRNCRAGRGQFSPQHMGTQLQQPSHNMGGDQASGLYGLPQGSQIISEGPAYPVQETPVPAPGFQQPTTPPTSLNTSAPQIPAPPQAPQASYMPFGMRPPTAAAQVPRQQQRPTFTQAMQKIRRMAGKSQLGNR